MIALVDYHKGNIKSVERGLAAQGSDVTVTDDPSVVAVADAIVLPGVGAFTDAMQTLCDLGMTDVLKRQIACGVPFLGICLGQHLLFEGGTEHAESGFTPGLGIMPGIVERIPKTDSAGRSYKIPHVGWNSIELTQPSPLFDGIPDGEFFYFTHSYVSPVSDCTIAETEHSIRFPSAVNQGNVYGVQFHPEKSSTAGARVLRNFVSLAREV